MTATAREITRSLRRHGDQSFVLVQTDSDRRILDMEAGVLSGAFVTWEAQGVTLPDQRRTGPCYALWRPFNPDSDVESIAIAVPPPPLMVRRARGQRTTRHKGVTRIDRDEKHTHGYQVRVLWQGKRYQSFFSDARYGDRLAALDAALKWRDATEDRIGKPRTEHQVFSQSQSETGMLGIRRRMEGETLYYEATWVEYDLEGRRRQRRTSFSAAKHGERGAQKRAQQARLRGERRRYRAPRRSA